MSFVREWKFVVAVSEKRAIRDVGKRSAKLLELQQSEIAPAHLLLQD